MDSHLAPTTTNASTGAVTRQEVELLTRRFSELATPATDKIDRSCFRDLLADTFGVDDTLLMDRGRSCVCVCLLARWPMLGGSQVEHTHDLSSDAPWRAHALQCSVALMWMPTTSSARRSSSRA